MTYRVSPPHVPVQTRPVRSFISCSIRVGEIGIPRQVVKRNESSAAVTPSSQHSSARTDMTAIVTTRSDTLPFSKPGKRFCFNSTMSLAIRSTSPRMTYRPRHTRQLVLTSHSRIFRSRPLYCPCQKRYITHTYSQVTFRLFVSFSTFRTKPLISRRRNHIAVFVFDHLKIATRQCCMEITTKIARHAKVILTA